MRAKKGLDPEDNMNKGKEMVSRVVVIERKEKVPPGDPAYIKGRTMKIWFIFMGPTCNLEPSPLCSKALLGLKST